jgi:hypothetical protein
LKQVISEAMPGQKGKKEEFANDHYR